MNDPTTTTTLSRDGQRRREAMLEELVATMHRRRRRRAAVAGSAAMLALASAVALLVRPAAPPGGGNITKGPAAPRAIPRMVLELVHPDTSILDRLAATTPSSAVILDDGQLLTELAAIELATGMIRMGGEVRLTSNVVTNEL